MVKMDDRCVGENEMEKCMFRGFEHESGQGDKPKQRGRQKERTSVDVLRAVSPGGKSFGDIKLESDTKVQYGETTRFVNSDINQMRSDNTPRSKEEKLKPKHITDAVHQLKAGEIRKTRNGWELTKVPSDVQSQRVYDPVRNEWRLKE
jgi:hypothetical protein